MPTQSATSPEKGGAFLGKHSIFTPWIQRCQPYLRQLQEKVGAFLRKHSVFIPFNLAMPTQLATTLGNRWTHPPAKIFFFYAKMTACDNFWKRWAPLLINILNTSLNDNSLKGGHLPTKIICTPFIPRCKPVTSPRKGGHLPMKIFCTPSIR